MSDNLKHFQPKEKITTSCDVKAGVKIVSINPKTGLLELKKDAVTNILQNTSCSKTLPVGIVSVLGSGQCGNSRTTSLLTSLLLEYYASGGRGGWMEYLLFGDGKPSSSSFPKVWKHDQSEEGIYLWPEPFLVHGYGYATQEDSNEMLLWILYGDFITSYQEITANSSVLIRSMLKEFLLMISSRLVEIIEFENPLSAHYEVTQNCFNLFYLLNSPNITPDTEAKKYLDAKILTCSTSSTGIPIKHVTCFPKLYSDSLVTTKNENNVCNSDATVINVDLLESMAGELMTLLCKLTDRTEVVPRTEEESPERFLTLATVQNFLQRCLNKVNKEEEIEPTSLLPASLPELAPDIITPAVMEHLENNDEDKDGSSSDDDSIFGDFTIPNLTKNLPNNPIKSDEAKNTSLSSDETIFSTQNSREPLYNTTFSKIQNKIGVMTSKSLNLSEVNDGIVHPPEFHHSPETVDPIIFHLTPNSITMVSCSTGEVVENEYGQPVTSAIIGLTSEDCKLVYGPRVAKWSLSSEESNHLSWSWSLQQLLLSQDTPRNTDVILVDYNSSKYYPVTYETTLGFLLKSLRKCFIKTLDGNNKSNSALIIASQEGAPMVLEKVKNAALLAGFSSGAVVNQSAMAAYTWMSGIQKKFAKDDYNEITGKILVLSEVNNILNTTVYKCHFSKDSVELISVQTTPIILIPEGEMSSSVAELPAGNCIENGIFARFLSKSFEANTCCSYSSPSNSGKSHLMRKNVLLDLISKESIRVALSETDAGLTLDNSVRLKSVIIGAAIMTESVTLRELMKDAVSNLGKVDWLNEVNERMDIGGLSKLSTRFQELDKIFPIGEYFVWKKDEGSSTVEESK